MNQLSQEYQVCKRTIHRDYQLRSTWQPSITELDPQKSLLKAVNRYEQIYRKASLLALQTQNESARVGALKVMLDVTKAALSVTNPQGVLAVPVGEVKLHWAQPQYNYDELTEGEEEILNQSSTILQRIQIRDQTDKPRLH